MGSPGPENGYTRFFVTALAVEVNAFSLLQCLDVNGSVAQVTESVSF